MSDAFKRPKPVVLLILDGFGLAPPYPGNAIANADAKAFNMLYKAYPHCQLHASGGAVGLPHGVMGNSEVGHMNIGAGRIVYQTLPRINSSITNGTFYDNEKLVEALEHCKTHGSNLHLMGLTSTGSVHSNIDHVYATLQLIQKHGFDGKRVFIHCFTDGRDTAPDSGKFFIEQLQNECSRRGIGRIATIIGRYYAMDRNSKWDRIQRAYNLITKGIGEKFADPIAAISSWYSKGITDEFIEATVITGPAGEIYTIKENDSVFFFNYRSDRAIQLTKAFVEPEFNLFERGPKLQNLFYIGMTQFDRMLNDKMYLAFEPENVTMPIGRVIAEHNLRQLRLAETEKFAHVTFFVNGGRDLVFPNEDRVLVPSPKVATYDMKPEMSTFEIAQVFVNKLQLGIYDFFVINIAAPDMVGHSGNFDATVKAVEAADRAIDVIVSHAIGVGGAVILTADHGNAEVMINYETGKPDTEHTTNPVPFICITQNPKPLELPLGLLEDVAPTILTLMNIPIPSTMSGRNLLERVY
jgi:2,3-bisphosphoglycerate-independent phosphoglycerate mutase